MHNDNVYRCWSNSTITNLYSVTLAFCFMVQNFLAAIKLHKNCRYPAFVHIYVSCHTIALVCLPSSSISNLVNCMIYILYGSCCWDELLARTISLSAAQSPREDRVPEVAEECEGDAAQTEEEAKQEAAPSLNPFGSSTKGTHPYAPTWLLTLSNWWHNNEYATFGSCVCSNEKKLVFKSGLCWLVE